MPPSWFLVYFFFIDKWGCLLFEKLFGIWKLNKLNLNKLKSYFKSLLLLLLPSLKRLKLGSSHRQKTSVWLPSPNSLTDCPGSDLSLCQQQITETASRERRHLFPFGEGRISLKRVANCFNGKCENFRPAAAKWAEFQANGSQVGYS